MTGGHWVTPSLLLFFFKVRCKERSILGLKHRRIRRRLRLIVCLRLWLGRSLPRFLFFQFFQLPLFSLLCFLLHFKPLLLLLLLDSVLFPFLLFIAPLLFSQLALYCSCILCELFLLFLFQGNGGLLGKAVLFVGVEEALFRIGLQLLRRAALQQRFLLCFLQVIDVDVFKD